MKQKFKIIKYYFSSSQKKIRTQPNVCMLQNYEKFGKRLHKHELQTSFCKLNAKRKRWGGGGGEEREPQEPLKYKDGNKDSLMWLI